MKFLSWNLRGINNPQKQYALKQFIFQEKVDYVLIQETKMSCASFDKIASHIWPGAEYLHMDADGASGGIATMWDPNSMKGTKVWKEFFIIITNFQSSIQCWGLINIYASNSRLERKETYDKWVIIIETIKDEHLMCMGDFDSPLYHSEKLGGNRECLESLQHLNDFMSRLDFMDVELRGNPYT